MTEPKKKSIDEMTDKEIMDDYVASISYVDKNGGDIVFKPGMGICPDDDEDNETENDE